MVVIDKKIQSDREVTLRNLICTKAYELIQLLEHCDSMQLIDDIVAAVANCDYVALEELNAVEDEDEQM